MSDIDSDIDSPVTIVPGEIRRPGAGRPDRADRIR